MSNNYEWKRLADLPVDGVYLHCQQTINGYVYVYSGRTKTGLMDDNFYKYSVELNSWEIIQPVGTKPTRRTGATSWVIDGKFYIYGGMGSSNNILFDLWVYTPESNSWNRLHDSVRHGLYAQSVVRNNKAIVFGGRTDLDLQTDTKFVSEYNPINGLWTNLPDNIESRILNSVSIDKNNNILLYGGVRKENGTSYNGLESITVYKENNTTTSSSHSPGRYGQTCFYIDTTDKFYFFGGLDSSISPMTTDNFVEYDNINSWTEIPNSPIARIYSGVSSINEEFIITGGAIGTDVADNRTNEVWAYVKKEEEKPKGWKKLKNLPVKLDMHKQATIGDDIYVFGGRVDGAGVVDTLYKYNIPSDTWSQIPKSGTWPTVKFGHVMVSINEKLYVSGGRNRNNYDNTTWEFDPLTTQWSAKTAMPVHKYLATAGVINNKMIVIGGSSGTNSLQNTTFAYDPENNTWTSYIPSQSFARLNPASAVVNDIMYIYGGSDASGSVRSANLHVIENAIISLKEDHLPARWQHTGVNYKDNVYFLFGCIDAAYTEPAPCERYDVLTNTWSIIPNSPSIRSFPASSSTSNGIVVTGGYIKDGTRLNEVWFYGELEEPKKYSWKRKPDIPLQTGQVGTREGSQATIGTDVYLFGGLIKQTNNTFIDNDKLFKFDTILNEWSIIQPIDVSPSGRSGAIMVELNGKLYLHGGLNRVSNSILNDMWEYDPILNKWTQKANLVPLQKHYAFVQNGFIYIGGGASSTSMNISMNDQIYKFEPINQTLEAIPASNIYRRINATVSYDENSAYIYGGADYTPTYTRLNSGFVFSDESISSIPNNYDTYGGTSTLLDGKLFVYGGNADNTFNSYNTQTGLWEEIIDGFPPNRILSSYSGIQNGYIVVGGDFDLYGTEVWEYSLDNPEPPKNTYSWKRRPDIPVGGNYTQLRFSAGATIGDDFYVFGGMLLDSTNTPSYTNRLWKYNTISKSWVEIQQQSVRPSVRNSHSMVSLNGKLYVYGGYTGTGASVNGQMWEYTPETNTWIVLATGINSIKHTMFVKNGKIYTSGGTTDNSTAGVINTLREFDPNLNEWRIVETNNGIYGRISATSSYNENFNVTYSGTIGSSIYLKTGFIIDSVVEEISSNYNGVVFACSGIIDDTFYVFGGNNNTESYPFISYELTSDTWKVIEDINTPPSRAGAAYANIPNGFIVSGAASSTLGLEVWEYSLDEDDPVPPDPEPEEWGYTEYTETTELIVPERARYMRTVAVGSGGQGHGSGGGALTAGYVPVTPGETLWLEINNNYSIVSAIRDGGKKVVIGASAAVNSLGGLKWSESNHLLTFNPLHYAIITSEWAGSNAVSAEVSRSCINTGTNRVRYWVGGAAAGYNADGNLSSTNGGRNGSVGDVGCVNGYYNYRGDGGGGVGLNGDVDSPRTPAGRGRGGSGGEDGVAYNSTPNSGKGGKYGGGNGSGYTEPTNNGGISIKWLSNYDVDETFNDSKVSVSYNNDDEIIDYQSSFDESLIDVSDFENPLSDNNNLKIDVSDYENPVGIYGNSGKITQVVKEKSRGRKVNHSTVDVSEHGDLQIRTNEAYLEISDEHEGFTNIYNKSIVTLSDKGELQIKSNYMWAEVSFNGIKYSKEFRLRETTPNTVTLSPIYDVEYDFIGIYPSDDTYDCEVLVNGVLQEKGEGKYFTLLLGDTIQFRITSPNPGEVKFVAINGDNILNIICPSKYGNYPDFLDFGEFTETFPNFWYETGELVIDGLYPLDSYSEIYVNNVRVWMVINDGEPTNRVNVTNGDRIKLVFKGSSPTELPEGETYKIYHDNDRGTYDIGQVVVKSIVVEGSETRQDIKFFIDMVILKTVTERQQLLLDSDYNHYQRTNHDSKNDFVLDSQHGIHDQDVSYIWDYTSIYENEVEYVWDKTSIFENTPNEYILDITTILENTPNEYIWDKTSIYESDEQSYDVNEYPSYIFDEYDTDVIKSIRIPISTDFDINVSDLKFEIDTSGFIDNNKAQYHINNEYDMHTQIIQYEIDNVYETVSGKDGNIHINAVEWIRNVEDISVLIDHVYEYYDLGIHNLVDSVYENNTTISKIYIDAEYVHFTYNQYYFEGSYTHILQAVHVPIDAVYDNNQTERWPTEAQEWEVVKVQYPAYADMVYYHLVKYNPYHIIDTEFQNYIHTESTDISGEYEEGTQHNNYKIDIVTDKGTSFVGYNFSGLYEKTEYNYHPVVTDKSLLVIGNSQTSVEGNDFEFVRDPVWQTDLIENLSGWHTREKAIEYAQSLNLSEEEIDLFEYEGRWGFTTDPELVVRDCSLPYPIIMIDKVIFWSH